MKQGKAVWFVEDCKLCAKRGVCPYYAPPYYILGHGGACDRYEKKESKPE